MQTQTVGLANNPSAFVARANWLIYVNKDFGIPIALTVDDGQTYHVVFCTERGPVTVVLPDDWQFGMGHEHMRGGQRATEEFKETVDEVIFMLRTAFPLDAFAKPLRAWLLRSGQVWGEHVGRAMRHARNGVFYSALVKAGLLEAEIRSIATACTGNNCPPSALARDVFKTRFAEDLKWDQFECNGDAEWLGEQHHGR